MFDSLLSCGDIPIPFELAYHSLRTWLASEPRTRTKELTWAMLPALGFHQVAEFCRTVARMLGTTDVDRHLT